MSKNEEHHSPQEDNSLSSLKKENSVQTFEDHDHVDSFWVKHPHVRNETLAYIPEFIRSWFGGCRSGGERQTTGEKV